MSLTFDAPQTPLFDTADLLFSRTDNRGVVLSGNAAFSRVSSFPLPEIVGAPHKIVRHPQMPKAVFRLLWQTISAGKPLGSYVCNKTKDGRIYWVFAIVFPLESGYLSLRLKPTGDMLADIVGLYADLSRRETEGSIDADESLVALHDAIGKMGFSTYDDFMTHALLAEVTAREKTLGREARKCVSCLQRLSARVTDIATCAEEVRNAFERTEQVPFNMRLEASRLETAEGPISTLATNHQSVSRTIKAMLDDLQSTAHLGTTPLRDSLFLAMAASLISELQTSFQAELGGSETAEEDFEILSTLKTEFRQKTQAAVANVVHKTKDLPAKCRAMRREVCGLEMTRIMCKVERSKHAGRTDGLDDVIDRLKQFENALSDSMARMEHHVGDIKLASEGLLRDSLLAA